MNSYNSVFTLDAKNELIINKVDIVEVEEYRKILDREDYKSILLYIYKVYDPRSSIYTLDQRSRIYKAKKDLKFNPKWTPDLDTRNLINRYKKDLKLSSSAKSFLAADKALFSIGEDVEMLQDEISYLKKIVTNRIRSLTSSKDLNKEDASIISELNNVHQNILKNQELIIKNIERIPKMKDTVDEIMSKYALEEGKKPIHGGGKLGNRE